MNGNKRKLMVFHQYLAPYRIDFFNALARLGEMDVFLFPSVYTLVVIFAVSVAARLRATHRKA